MDHQAFAQLLGNYGEFVGAIAVVATLGYLSVQVRANARITAMDARQGVLDRFSEAKGNTIDSKVTSIPTIVGEWPLFPLCTQSRAAGMGARSDERLIASMVAKGRIDGAMGPMRGFPV